jgi:hypothetical protein
MLRAWAAQRQPAHSVVGFYLFFGYACLMVFRKMPIGIQDFEYIRREGFVYVDKTA